MRLPRQSRGDACVLVAVHSGLAEHAEVPETVYAALGHFGIPYRIVDLAKARIDRETLERSAALLIGQQNIGLGIDAETQRTILASLDDGLGLVSLDFNIAAWDPGLSDALRLTGATHNRRFSTAGVDAVGIRTSEHYLTYTQAEGAEHRFRMPLPATRARVADGTEVLAETPDGAPAVVAGRRGAGRFVQWLVSPRIFMLQYFGHAHGLDDLFWKGIVWAARKPFAMLAIPPFVRFRFDDCNGLWRTPEDMAFLDVLTEHGHKPNMCVCMHALEPTAWRKLKALQDAGRVEVAPHTWKGGVSLFYGENGSEYSSDIFGRMIRETKAMLDRAGVRPSKILSDHEHEYSSNVLPYLSQLGIEYKMNVMLPGETWAGAHVDWRPKPYGSMSYALDYTPGTYPLFVVFNHYPAFDAARSYIGPSRFLLNRAGGYGAYMWDFLNGLTTRDLPRNDVDGMAERLAEHTRLGLNSLFFGGSISHSHFTEALSVTEWRTILDRYEKRTERFEKINVGYDDIAEFARSRFHTHLAGSRRRSGGLSLMFTGKAPTPLKVSVFEDRGGVPERRYVDVPVFTERARIETGAP